jgi:hypothetical protein
MTQGQAIAAAFDMQWKTPNASNGAITSSAMNWKSLGLQPWSPAARSCSSLFASAMPSECSPGFFERKLSRRQVRGIAEASDCGFDALARGLSHS